MKLIAVTQRVEVNSSYHEVRDSLDEKWAEFLFLCGYLMVPIPNNLVVVKELVNQLNFDGILLTGGNTEVKYGGSAPQRDEVDSFLINFSLSKNIPLIGVCRGMQSIVSFFGGELFLVNNHVGKNHNIYSPMAPQVTRSVNSYHNLGLPYKKTLAESIWTINFVSEDNYVESVSHNKYMIHGIMWHPERNDYFDKFDIRFFKDIFGN